MTREERDERREREGGNPFVPPEAEIPAPDSRRDGRDGRSGRDGAPPPVAPAVPQSSFTGDLYGLNAQTLISVEPEHGPDYWISAPAAVYEGSGRDRRIVGWIRKWQWIWYGAAGGGEKTYGDLERDHNRLSSSDGIDTRWDRFAFLTLLQSTATGPDPTGNQVLYWQNIFDTLIMGIGGGVNVSLIKETSATDSTEAAIIYSPGAAITCLTTCVIGGIATALRLIVGRNGSAAQIISDATGTVDATMHANTASMWWGYQTILLNRPFVFQAGTTVYYLLQTAATGDAPTASNLTLPAGGAGLSLMQRGSGPMRIYLLIPKSSNTTGALVFGAEKKMKVISISQEATDPQEMGPDDFLGIDNVTDAIAWEGGIVVTDSKRIVFNNDDTKEEFGWTRDREPDSDREYRVRGFIRKGPELLILVNQIVTAVGNPPAGVNTRIWLESYDHRTHAFHRISKSVTLTTTGELGVKGAGGLPWSLATGFVHFYADGSWYRKFEPPYGINPYNYYRQTAAAGSTTGQQYAANVSNIAGTLKTPKFLMRGTQGWRNVVSRITRLGDNLGGGASAQVTYTIGGVAATFDDYSASTNVLADGAQVKDFDDNEAWFYLAQLQVDIKQGSSTYKTPNAAPVLIEGYTFIGMDPRRPKFIHDEEIGIMPGPFSLPAERVF